MNTFDPCTGAYGVEGELLAWPPYADCVHKIAGLVACKPHVRSFPKNLAWPGIVNRLAVHAEPVPNVLEPFHRFRRPPPVGHGAEANLKVATLRRNPNEVLKNPFRRFVNVIGPVRKGLPTGINDFPNTLRGPSGYFPLRRVIVPVGSDARGL